MNWLAHILLSRRDTEYQLGNFLADPLKGKPWDGAGYSVELGMLMHKSIDVFTDSHEIVSKSKSRLGDKGYLKGVIIDLLYDHYLASSWRNYANTPLDEFVYAFNSSALNVSAEYPEQPKRIVSKLASSNLLAEYANFEGFVHSLERVDKRLSPRIRQKDSTLNYLSNVEEEYEALKSDFEIFFPQLIDFFKNHKLGSQSDHYLISTHS